MIKIDQIIDLRGVSCPLNYVKTKLILEKMKVGQVIDVLLDDGDPILHVTRTVKEDGHKILEVKRVGDYFEVLVKKEML